MTSFISLFWFLFLFFLTLLNLLHTTNLFHHLLIVNRQTNLPKLSHIKFQSKRAMITSMNLVLNFLLNQWLLHTIRHNKIVQSPTSIKFPSSCSHIPVAVLNLIMYNKYIVNSIYLIGIQISKAISESHIQKVLKFSPLLDCKPCWSFIRSRRCNIDTMMDDIKISTQYNWLLFWGLQKLDVGSKIYVPCLSSFLNSNEFLTSVGNVASNQNEMIIFSCESPAFLIVLSHADIFIHS